MTDIKRNYQWATNFTDINWLVAEFGAAEATSRLGVSAGSIANWIADGKCKITYARLASALRQLHERKAEGTAQLWIIRVPQSRQEILRTFLKGAELRHSQFTIE